MAAAQDDHRFNISLGAFITDRGAETRVDAADGTPGTPVDIEGELGLQSSETVLRLDGSLTDLYAGIDYQLFTHAAIGLGLNSMRMDVDVSGSRLNGSLDWQYDGVLLFCKLDF